MVVDLIPGESYDIICEVLVRSNPLALHAYPVGLASDIELEGVPPQQALIEWYIYDAQCNLLITKTSDDPSEIICPIFGIVNRHILESPPTGYFLVHLSGADTIDLPSSGLLHEAYVTIGSQRVRVFGSTSGVIKQPQNTVQNGFTPMYEGVSYCTREVIKPPDMFPNTGDELILIKDGGGASTHDITVTSSLDPLINVNYNIALDPDHSKILGPYALDDYGELPTITYDNTNLYVSILKVSAL